MLGLVFQGESQDSGHRWLDPLKVALEHRSFFQGVVVEEPRCSGGGMR